MTDAIQIEQRKRDALDWYSGYVYKCRLFEERFARHLQKSLRHNGLADAQLETRTKSPESFVAKAVKRMPDGEFKYADLRQEITDLVGARILVPLSTDVAPVLTMLRQEYVVDEELERGQEEGHIDVPGYQSRHLLVRLQKDEREDVDLREFGDMTVEIQVRTILQHAWASLQHDLMYKTERAPTASIRRRLIALAGLLELADREFVQVRQSHSEVGEIESDEMQSASGKLTASSLRHLNESMFDEEDPAAHVWFVALKDALDDLDITSVEQLRRVLDEWLDQAPRVAAAVREAKPWVNTAYLLDLLLRLALREGYFDRRFRQDEKRPYADSDIEILKREYLAELDLIAEKVTGA
jgi:ppGpp synthetase/RelA/SpoT-type nucleotidyltranferase